MAGYNLPDNVSASDPWAPWNQEERPTRVTITVHYGGQTAAFERSGTLAPRKKRRRRTSAKTITSR